MGRIIPQVLPHQTNEPRGDTKFSSFQHPATLTLEDSPRGESTACKASIGRVSIPMLSVGRSWHGIVYECDVWDARRASIAMTRFTNARSRNVLLVPLIDVLSDCRGSRDRSAPIRWGPVVPPMLDISTEFGADPSSRRG